MLKNSFDSKIMLNGIKQLSVVGKDGRIELTASELPEGTPIEVIILVEPSETDETDYLLSTPANRQQLLSAIEGVEERRNLVVFTPEEWHEK
jgi:antitoxin YefM